MQCKMRHAPCTIDPPDRRRVPVRVPAWAQGQTLSCVGVYLTRSVFSHGQLYVAFSRSSSVSGISVICPAPENEGDDLSVVNDVYPEVLGNA